MNKGMWSSSLVVTVKAIITCISRKGLCQALDPLLTGEDTKAQRGQVTIQDHTAKQDRSKVPAQVLTAEPELVLASPLLCLSTLKSPHRVFLGT